MGYRIGRAYSSAGVVNLQAYLASVRGTKAGERGRDRKNNQKSKKIVALRVARF